MQCRRPGFDPWVRKSPWKRKWQPTPIFLPGKSRVQRNLAGLQSVRRNSTTKMTTDLLFPILTGSPVPLTALTLISLLSFSLLSLNLLYKTLIHPHLSFHHIFLISCTILVFMYVFSKKYLYRLRR